MSGLDIDTRTDVYSLGVLLYELLTGTTPFDKRQLASGSQAEVQRIIRETEPPTPSKRVTTDFHAAASGDVALDDPTGAHQLAKQLRGDLDWIVMKCLEKDRARRYASVADLQRDLENHLADRTVAAGPPSTAYRLSRFARRNRGVLASLSIVFVALVTGLALALSGMRAAQFERDAAMAARESAMAEAKRAQACVDLVVEMFQSADPTGLRPRQDSVKTLLDDFTAMHSERLDAQPDVALTIHRVAGNAYSALGELDKAQHHSDAALTLAQRMLGDLHLATAEALDLSALIDLRRGMIAEAKGKLESSLATKRALDGPDSHGIAETLMHYSKAQRLAHDHDGSVATATLALAMMRRVHGESHSAVATAHYNLAVAYAEKSRLDEAEKEAQAAHDLYVETLRTDHPYVAMALSEIANIALLKGDLPRARDLQDKALALRLAALGEGHYEVAINRANLALVIRELGEADRAIELLRSALAIVAKTFGETAPQYAAMVGSLGATYMRAGKIDEAETELRRAVAMQTALAGRNSIAVATQLGNLGIVMSMKGELDEAEQIAREVATINREKNGQNHQATVIAHNNLALVLDRQSKLDEALRTVEASLDGIRGGVGTRHPLYAETKLLHADLLSRIGKRDAAEANLREALSLMRESKTASRAKFADGLESLALLLGESDKLDEAIPLLDECMAVRSAQRNVPEWRVERARSIRGGLLIRLGRFDDALMDLSTAEHALSNDPSAPVSEHQKTVQRLVALYEAWGRGADAAAWRNSLERP
jgi:eukaryotic-like serine/threonine-protein kinase